MPQRKSSDKAIKEKAKELATHPVMGHDPDKENKILKGMRWVNSYDPWLYVKDGELPELHALVKHGNGRDKVSEKILFKVDDGSLGYYTTGHYRFYENKDGKRYYFEEESTQTEFEISEIKCFQYIEEPQK